jgi:hypothetical protein
MALSFKLCGMSRKRLMSRETEKEDYITGEYLQIPASTHDRTNVKTQVLNTRIGPRLNLQLTEGCLLFHENHRPNTTNTSSFVVFRMAGCNIIQDISPASVSKKLECKIFAASCTICHAVSVIIQKLVGKGSHTPDG